MKTKLFFLTLFICSYTFSQNLPTGHYGRFEFSGGSLINASPGSGPNFNTPSSITLVNDRFGNAGDAIGSLSQMGGHTLGSTNYMNTTLSFWIKNGSSSSSFRERILQIYGTGGYGYKLEMNGAGFYLDAKAFNGTNGQIIRSHSNLGDNQWHHIVIRTTAIVSNTRIAVDVFVDGVLKSGTSGIIIPTNSHVISNFLKSAQLVVSVGSTYLGSIDDIYFYKSSLTDAQINDIYNYVPLDCFAPTNIVVTSTSATTTNVSWDIAVAAATYDVTYVEAGGAINTGITISNINGTSTTLTGLTDGTNYDIYVRNNCTGVNSAQSEYSSSTQLLNRSYVDTAATGDNTGSSWTNAYTSLQTALANIDAGDEIWIAKGTYKPHVTDRNVSFNINTENANIYGGFAGTETQLIDRNNSLIHTTNSTILSGDLLADDDTNITYNNTTRGDNSLRIIQIKADNILIDGVTIANGYANGSSGEGRFGAALDTDDSVGFFTIKNSIIKNNVAWWAAGLMLTSNISTSTMTIDKCIFDNNLSSGSAAFYVLPKANRTMNFNLTNSLFKNNKTDNNTTSRKGYGTSAGFIRAYYTGVLINAVVVNNTFVNNQNLGTTVGSDFPVLGISKENGSFGTLTIANNIFWGNTENGGATAKAFGKAIDANLPNNTTVYNSIDQDGFSNITYKLLTTISNPLFTSATDFTLQTGSPAIDSGDNSKMPSGITTDLLGAQRIFNTTVDMGCYEFGAALGIEENVLLEDFKLYPNPVRNTLIIKLAEALEKIEVYSILGRKVLENNTSTINVSNLSSGLYLLKVYTQDGKVGVKRFIKE